LFASSWGTPSYNFFGNLPSSILWICPHHWNCSLLMSSKSDLVTFILSLIAVLLVLSVLEILAERHKKSISLESTDNITS
jgi:hypothetical protein